MTRYILKKTLLGIITLLLSITLLSGCFERTLPTKVSFQPMYKNMPLSCESNFHSSNEKTISSDELIKWQYQQLQFYIHGVEVNTRKNGWQPWGMTTNSNQAHNSWIVIQCLN